MALRFIKCVAVVAFVHVLAAAVVFGAYFATTAGSTGNKGGGPEFGLIDPAAPPGSGVIHEVRAGETYAAVAQTYGITVEALLEANSRRTSQALRAGERLKIPGHE